MTDSLSLQRDLLLLSGEDTVSFLQGLLTQNVESLAAGQMAFGALLTPQGKILDTMFLSHLGDAILIDVAAGRGEVLRKKLMLYRLRAKIDIVNVTDEFIVGIGAIPDEALLSQADPRTALLGQRWVMKGPSAIFDVADTELALIETRHGVPTYSRDYGEADVFPLDVNLDLLHGIDHKKGCFVGQEVASRMFRKGEIRKRTWKVAGDHLQSGEEIKCQDKTIGRITSANKMEGLALIRLDRLPDNDGEFVTVSGTNVQLEQPDYF